MELKRKSHLLSLLTLALLLAWSCDNALKTKSGLSPNAVVSARSGGNAPSASAETAGNNLSYPVIWSDGVQLPLRGTFGTTLFNGSYFTTDGYDWYVQNDVQNEWQAESRNEGTLDTYITSIDWGDNLEAKPWSVGDRIRVEIVLKKKLDDTMLAYRMKMNNTLPSGYAVNLLQPNATGTTEIWGTNKETYSIDTATVYSGVARLIVQKINAVPEGETPNITWDPTLNYWSGDIGTPLVDQGVWQTTTGPGYFSAEVNVQGKIVYGYNWATNSPKYESGYYRLTLQLDKTNNGSITCSTVINSDTKIEVGGETVESLVLLAAAGGGETGGGVAAVGDNLSYIDVYLGPRNGSGRPSGGNGGNSGDHGSGNGHKGGNHTVGTHLNTHIH